MNVRKIFNRFFGKANPAFAMTLRMRACQRIFYGTIVCYCLALIGLIITVTTFPQIIYDLTPDEFFELVFLIATCSAVVFLGSDFGVVFIEATFQDELLRLTPVTPLQIVHGGICSSLFFSSGLLFPAFPVLVIAFFLQLPVERIFYGTLLMFLFGQELNLVLLSCYIKARSWKEIWLGTSMTFLLIMLFVGFCFTRFGRQLLIDPNHWQIPMAFLFAVSVSIIGIAYGLARSHANSPRRSLRASVLINIAVYVPFLAAVCTVAIFC